MAGSGILSFISAQAGAKQVVALEASSMAEKMAAVSLMLSEISGYMLIRSLSKRPTQAPRTHI